MQHARQSLRSRIGEDSPEVGDDGARPDGDGAAELLEPDFGPVLAEGSRKKFEVAEDFEPFVKVEFEVLLGGTAEKTAAPAAAAAVGYRLAD